MHFTGGRKGTERHGFTPYLEGGRFYLPINHQLHLATRNNFTPECQDEVYLNREVRVT